MTDVYDSIHKSKPNFYDVQTTFAKKPEIKKTA